MAFYTTHVYEDHYTKKAYYNHLLLPFRFCAQKLFYAKKKSGLLYHNANQVELLSIVFGKCTGSQSFYLIYFFVLAFNLTILFFTYCACTKFKPQDFPTIQNL